MQVIIDLLTEAVNSNMGARSKVALRNFFPKTVTRPSQRQRAPMTLIGVVCGALLLGLFGSGAGAIWSLALGFGAGIGALCGGLGVFALGLVLVPVNARVGTTFSLGVAALVVLAVEMALGAVVWGIRVALGACPSK
jgi:hypothetical protein